MDVRALASPPIPRASRLTPARIVIFAPRRARAFRRSLEPRSLTGVHPMPRTATRPHPSCREAALPLGSRLELRDVHPQTLVLPRPNRVLNGGCPHMHDATPPRLRAFSTLL